MRTAVACLALLSLIAPAAAQTSFTLGLSITGDAERRLVRYDCDGLDSFDAEYINAAPNFLALLPVDGQNYLFASVISASGAKYASGQYVWWTKGPEADLFDISQGEDAPAVAHCSEHIQTP